MKIQASSATQYVASLDAGKLGSVKLGDSIDSLLAGAHRLSDRWDGQIETQRFDVDGDGKTDATLVLHKDSHRQVQSRELRVTVHTSSGTLHDTFVDEPGTRIVSMDQKTRGHETYVADDDHDGVADGETVESSSSRLKTSISYWGKGAPIGFSEERTGHTGEVMHPEETVGLARIGGKDSEIVPAGAKLLSDIEPQWNPTVDQKIQLQYDLNGDGKVDVTVHEVLAALTEKVKSVDAQYFDPTTGRSAWISDANADGRIDFVEMSNADHSWLRDFRDTDHDGKIDEVSGHDPDHSSFDQQDRNGDGAVDWERLGRG